MNALPRAALETGIKHDRVDRPGQAVHLESDDVSPVPRWRPEDGRTLGPNRSDCQALDLPGMIDCATGADRRTVKGSESHHTKVYVVTAPEDRRGIYETWDACKAAVHGVAGARYQSVGSREEAEAILSGSGVVLSPGLYAFVDGNHEGGIGVVLVRKSGDGSVAVLGEISTSVHEVFDTAGLETLESPEAVRNALARIRNVLAEIGGLYVALGRVPAGAEVTIVHDYEGVGAWITGRWRAKDATVAQVVAACRNRIAEHRIRVTFRHQRGHQSTYAGVNEFAEYNRRADALATQASAGRTNTG